MQDPHLCRRWTCPAHSHGVATMFVFNALGGRLAVRTSSISEFVGPKLYLRQVDNDGVLGGVTSQGVIEIDRFARVLQDRAGERRVARQTG